MSDVPKPVLATEYAKNVELVVREDIVEEEIAAAQVRQQRHYNQEHKTDRPSMRKDNGCSCVNQLGEKGYHLNRSLEGPMRSSK